MTDKEKEIHMKTLKYIKHFEIQYNMLLNRFDRFLKIDEPFNDNIDIGTYFDIIIVQLRAIFIESPKLKNNYTVQNLMIKIGKPELANRLDDIFDKCVIEDSTWTVRETIKFLADKFICHYDDSEGENETNWSEALYLESFLRNPYNVVNLKTIMQEITSIVSQGLEEYKNELLN